MANNPDEILEQNLDWADGIARQVHRHLPPSFDLADLQQIAWLETWERARLFDSTAGVPFKGYAYRWVLGAVQMAVRRRKYQDATSEELDFAPLDERPNAEEALLADERDRAAAVDSQNDLKLLLAEALANLGAMEAYLVQRVYVEGVGVAEIAATWRADPDYVMRRLARAVRRFAETVPGQMLRERSPKMHAAR